MKTLRITSLLIFIFLITGISGAASSFFPSEINLGFKKKFSPSDDTSKVYRYIRNALKSSLKSQSIDYVKTNIDSAESICREERIEFPSLLHLARAEYFFLTGDFSNSSQEATIAMKKAESSGETDVLIHTMTFLGRYNHRTGLFSESIEYYSKSISLAQKHKLRGYIPGNYYHIADVYNSLGNLKEYRTTLQKVIDASKEENDTSYLETGYFRLGTSYTEKDRNYKSADSLLRKCLEISLIKKDSGYTALSLANLGWNFYLEKKYDPSIKSYNKSLSYSLPSKRYSFAANALGNLGTIYRDLGNTEKSIQYYNKSIEQAKKVEDVYNLYWVYQDMSEMYLRNKDTANAYKSYVLFKKYNDSFTKATSIQDLSNAKIRYEADTHNKELQLLSLRVKNQRILIYGYTGLFILSLAILILLLSRAKINAKRRISEMNQKISEVTQANLRQQMNPHFIFNTLNSIQYYMYQHDKLATNNYLTKFSSLMRKVLENSQHTSVTLHDELDALNLYLELETIRFKNKFTYEIKVDEEIDTLLYKIPTMLIQPYVENSICHGLMPAKGKGYVKINLKLNSECINCTVEDNGIGREAARERKIECENSRNSLGTQIASSRLDLVNALYGTSLKIVYTDLKNIVGEPLGTRVEIHIPIMT
ncbi:MAG: tetratricopeptide repeat protein [Bacteroidales bacterium]|nr:tetratricopeptide repeat protein [Bacteroidales bacterium]